MYSIGKGYPAKLLKTGQTTQYGGYADDGYYEKGKAKSYVRLTSGQFAGTVVITLNLKTDNLTNNCVRDRRTGLLWKSYYSQDIGPGNDGRVPWTTNANGEGIFTYVAAANAAKLSGYADWRIPNKYELGSLLNGEAPDGRPDTTAFVSWSDNIFIYSSSTVPYDTTLAVAFRTLHGFAVTQVKTGNAYVLLVRG